MARWLRFRPLMEKSTLVDSITSSLVKDSVAPSAGLAESPRPRFVTPPRACRIRNCCCGEGGAPAHVDRDFAGESRQVVDVDPVGSSACGIDVDSENAATGLAEIALYEGGPDHAYAMRRELTGIRQGSAAE